MEIKMSQNLIQTNCFSLYPSTYLPVYKLEQSVTNWIFNIKELLLIYREQVLLWLSFKTALIFRDMY